MGELVLNWRQVFQGLNPEEILTRVGGKWSKTTTGFKIIGQEYSLVNNFLLPVQTPVKFWPGGDAVDTAALACEGDYDKALKWMVSAFPEFATRYAGLDHHLLASEIARQAAHERYLLNLSLGHITTPANAITHPRIAMFLRRHHQDLAINGPLLYFPATIRYLRTVANIPVELPDLPGAKDEVICMPLFSDWWTVAGWNITIPETGKEIYWPHTQAADAGVGGLWKMRPGSNSQVFLVSWPESQPLGNPSNRQLLVKLFRAPEKRHWGISGFIKDPVAGMHEVHWLGDLFNPFKIIDLKNRKELNCDQYVAENIAVALARDLKINPELSQQIENVVITQPIRIMVSELLKQQGLVHLTALLNEQPSARKYKFGANQLIERNSELCLKTEQGEQCLANFRVEFNHILAFPERPQEPYWHVTAWINGFSTPLTISPQAAKKSTDIIASINAALNATKQPHEARLLEHISGKMVMRVILDKAARAKKKFGVAKLGLSFDRSVYRYPGLQVSKTGELKEEYLPHPEMPLLSHFSVPPASSRCLPSPAKFTPGPGKEFFGIPRPVDEDMRRWLCIMAASLIRSQLHLSVPPLFIRDSTIARQKCTALFSIFGQISPIIFKTQHIGPELIRTFSGYPCWGIIGKDTMPAVDGPTVVLHEEQGYNAVGGFNNLLNESLPLLSAVWLEFVEAILSIDFKTYAIELTDNLESMGERFFIKQCPSAIVWSTPEAKYPGLCRVLMDTPVENIGQLFTGAGEFVVMRSVPANSRAQIISELQTQNINAAADTNLGIRINREKLSQVLREFYKTTITL